MRKAYPDHVETSTPKPAKVSPLARDFSRWLFRYSPGIGGKPVPLVDPFDWGRFDRDKERPTRTTRNRLDAFYRYNGLRPTRLSGPKVAAHLEDREKFYTTSNPNSGFVFPMIDVDAHEGQRDAESAAEFVVQAYLPGAYYERSPRGCHAHPVIRIGSTPQTQVNQLLAEMQRGLRTIVKRTGYGSTIEVKGGFTEREQDGSTGRMATLAALPKLPDGRRDLDRLTGAPVFFVSVFDAIAADARETEGNVAKSLDTNEINENPASSDRNCSHIPYVLFPASASSLPDPDDAFRRMHWACGGFIRLCHRLPSSVDELLAHYQRSLDTHPATPARTRRARDVLRFWSKGFDPSKAGAERGYLHYRDDLLSAVGRLCQDRTNRVRLSVSDEELSAYLYLVMAGSFAVREEPSLQWTVPNNSAAAFFGRLSLSSVADVACGHQDDKGRWHANRDKVAAIKAILTRAGLIECVDSNYIYSSDRTGVGKKYTIGKNCWRYGEFARFAEGIRYTKAADVQQRPTRTVPAAGERHPEPAARRRGQA